MPKYTSKDLAEAIVFPVTRTPAQKKEASEQLAEARKKEQQEMSEMDRLVLEILHIKLKSED